MVSIMFSQLVIGWGLVLMVCGSSPSNASGTGDDVELRVLGMLPMTGSAFPGGGACLPAIDMALEGVNSRADMLPGYKLTYEYVDSMCNQGMAVFRLMEALNAAPPYLMVLGGLCSAAIEATSEWTHLWNLTHLAIGGTAMHLNNKTRFPKLYRLASPDNTFNGPRIALLKAFNWRKIAIIHQAREIFSTAMEEFIKVLEGTDISIITNEIFLHDPYKRVQSLQRKDVRIIYAFMYEDRARDTLCAAYKLGFYGPKIVWIFPGWFSNRFWERKLDLVACSKEDIATAAEGTFLLTPLFRNPVQERGLPNITSMEFDELFQQHPLYDPINKPFDFLAADCFDHIWMTALTLNCTLQRLSESGHPKRLEEFTYSDGDMHEIIFGCLGNTTLNGMHQRISFKEGTLTSATEIFRIQNNKPVRLAPYVQETRPFHYDWIDGALIWKDGKIPRDSTYVVRSETVVPITLYGTICASAGVGILASLALLVFNMASRNNSVIKMSSFAMNNVLLCGCILCYTSTMFKTSGTSDAAICVARTFTLGVGFSLGYGSLFCRTWRVYRHFTNDARATLTITDTHLVRLLTGCVGVVMVILVAWEATAPHTILVQYLYDEVYSIGNDVEVRPFVRVCHSEYSRYFGWVIAILFGAWLTFGAFLAFETRRERVSGQADSQLIGVCIYNVMIMCAAGLTMVLSLTGSYVTLYSVTSGCIVIATTLTLCILFIPKVLGVYRGDPMDDLPVEIPSHPTSGNAPQKENDNQPSPVPVSAAKPAKYSVA